MNYTRCDFKVMRLILQATPENQCSCHNQHCTFSKKKHTMTQSVGLGSKKGLEEDTSN